MTYAISSAVKRYERGTATSPALRAAWTTAIVSSEFGPHHTMRAPCSAPSASSPGASRFTRVLSSANVVVENFAPWLASTITASLSGDPSACSFRTSGIAATEGSSCTPVHVRRGRAAHHTGARTADGAPYAYRGR